MQRDTFQIQHVVVALPYSLLLVNNLMQTETGFISETVII